MPEPIGSGFPTRDVGWYNAPEEGELHDRFTKKLDEQTFGVCRDPQSVLDGVICGDDTAISNACRRAKPESVDAYICDDKNLAKAEDTAWEIAKKAAWKAVELFFGAKVSKP